MKPGREGTSASTSQSIQRSPPPRAGTRFGVRGVKTLLDPAGFLLFRAGAVHPQRGLWLSLFFTGISIAPHQDPTPSPSLSTPGTHQQGADGS